MFATTNDNQTSVIIRIAQGVSRGSSPENQTLGEPRALGAARAAARRGASIAVTFGSSAPTGTLSVRAKDVRPTASRRRVSLLTIPSEASQAEMAARQRRRPPPPEPDDVLRPGPRRTSTGSTTRSSASPATPTPTQVREAFHRFALRHHPDQHVDAASWRPASLRIFKRGSEGYRCCSTRCSAPATTLRAQRGAADARRRAPPGGAGGARGGGVGARRCRRTWRGSTKSRRRLQARRPEERQAFLLLVSRKSNHPRVQSLTPGRSSGGAGGGAAAVEAGGQSPRVRTKITTRRTVAKTAPDTQRFVQHRGPARDGVSEGNCATRRSARAFGSLGVAGAAAGAGAARARMDGASARGAALGFSARSCSGVRRPPSPARDELNSSVASPA